MNSTRTKPIDPVDLRVRALLLVNAQEAYIGRTSRDDEYDSEDEPVNEDEPRTGQADHSARLGDDRGV